MLWCVTCECHLLEMAKFLENWLIKSVDVFMFDCVSRRVCVCAYLGLLRLNLHVCVCVCVYLGSRERERERSSSVSACKLKRLHLCGSAPWQKAWVRPSLRGVIDGRVAVVTRCKQEQAVSLFAAWRLSPRRAIVTPDVPLMMNRDKEDVYWVRIRRIGIFMLEMLIWIIKLIFAVEFCLINSFFPTICWELCFVFIFTWAWWPVALSSSRSEDIVQISDLSRERKCL